MTSAARSECVPMTTRSGFMKSSTATPSRRNSGFDTTAKCSPRTIPPSSRAAETRSDVPTGTVLLSTITL